MNFFSEIARKLIYGIVEFRKLSGVDLRTPFKERGGDAVEKLSPPLAPPQEPRYGIDSAWGQKSFLLSRYFGQVWKTKIHCITSLVSFCFITFVQLHNINGIHQDLLNTLLNNTIQSLQHFPDSPST
jgi:hypothetical protein